MQKVKEDQAKRQEKRSTNIAAKSQLKKDRKRFGKKKALQMNGLAGKKSSSKSGAGGKARKRPGFEGSSLKK